MWGNAATQPMFTLWGMKNLFASYKPAPLFPCKHLLCLSLHFRLASKKQNINIWVIGLLSSINKTWIDFRQVDTSSGPIGASGVGVMTSEGQRVGPCILLLTPSLQSEETQVIREASEGPVGSSSFLPLPPSRRASCMVDIIFSSSFLGDMGDHSKSK